MLRLNDICSIYLFRSAKVILFVYSFLFCVILTAATESQQCSVSGTEECAAENTGDEPIPVDTECYKAVIFSDIYVAIAFDHKVINPPKYLELDLKITITSANEPPDIHRVGFYLVWKPHLCKTTISFSNNKIDFTLITVSADVYSGVRWMKSLYHFDVKIQPSINSGLKRFSSKENLAHLYIYYRAGIDQPIPSPPLPSIDDLRNSLKVEDFNTNYICIAYDSKVFVIRPIDWNTRDDFQIYKSIVIRVYSDEDSIFEKRVFAWPCPDGVWSFDSIRPRLIIDNNVENPYIVFTVDSLSAEDEPISIPRDNLHTTVHFETANVVEKLSYRENWLEDQNTIFLFETEKIESQCDKVPDVGKKLIYNIAKVEGKIVEAWLEIPDAVENGFSAVRNRIITDMGKCNTVIRVV